MIVRLLLTKFIDLHACAQATDVDRKLFAGKSRNYADLYKQAEAQDRIDNSGERIGELTMRVGRFFDLRSDDVTQLINGSGRYPEERAARASDAGSFFLVVMQNRATGLCRQVEFARLDLAMMN